ncbi:hypothetical protein [Zoogloea sp.]|uniref:hypothetical protein n=1 Tax=Zoogloea sp. TaxID=49181 RepID=UPI0035B12C84
MSLTVLRTGLAALLGAAALVAHAAGPAHASPPLLNPVQAAYLQAETRRVEETFVQKVMSITGASREQVLAAIPAKGRITDRLARIYSALEQSLRQPLSDEQKGLIFAAEGERRQALKDLPAQAAAR